jgi:hypothetical protein
MLVVGAGVCDEVGWAVVEVPPNENDGAAVVAVEVAVAGAGVEAAVFGGPKEKPPSDGAAAAVVAGACDVCVDPPPSVKPPPVLGWLAAGVGNPPNNDGFGASAALVADDVGGCGDAEGNEKAGFAVLAEEEEGVADGAVNEKAGFEGSFGFEAGVLPNNVDPVDGAGVACCVEG